MKRKASLYMFIVFLVTAIMIVVAFGPAVGESKAPAPIKTAVALLGSNNVHAAGQTVSSKDECDDDSEECCEDEGVPDSEEHPKCTPTAMPTRIVPQPSLVPSDTPAPTATAVNTPTPTRTPLPTVKPTSTPHGMVKTPVPTVVSPTCTCQQIMTLTWNEKDDGANWLIARFKYLRSQGICVSINTDFPSSATWIDEVNQTIDSLYALYK